MPVWERHAEQFLIIFSFFFYVHSTHIPIRFGFLHKITFPCSSLDLLGQRLRQKRVTVVTAAIPHPRSLPPLTTSRKNLFVAAFPPHQGPHNCSTVPAFHRGGVHSFVCLQAGISLGFQTEVSLAHLSLPTLVLPKGKAERWCDCSW